MKRTRASVAWSRALLSLALVFAFAANAQHMGLVVHDAKSLPGAEVAAVTPGSPAAKAELKPGDVIVAVQGKAVASAEEFVRASHALAPGSAVALRVLRGGWEKEVRLQAPQAQASFGFAVANAPTGTGAVIASVDPGGAAAAAGLAAGDRIARAGGRAVVDAAQLRAQIDEAAAKGAPLALTLERGGWAKEAMLVARQVLPAGTAGAVAAAANAPASTSIAASTLTAEMDEANRQYDAGDWRAAEASYRRLAQAVGDDPRIAGRLCHVLVMQERYTDAIEACRRAAALAPGEANIQQNIGYGLSRLGHHGEAIAAYQKAIELAPKWAAPYAATAASYFAQRNWARAEEYYRFAVARDPNDRAAWQALGDVTAEQGKTGEAIAAYRKALDLGPASVELLRGLGWQLYRERRHAEAEPWLRDANRLKPTDVEVLTILGSVEEKLGKLAEAKQAWQRAAELDPTGPNGAIARQNLAALAAVAATPLAPPPAPERPASPSDATVRVPTAGPSAPPVEYGRPSSPPAATPPLVNEARAAPQAPEPRTLAPSALASGPHKAAIAVGDFQVKAANAGPYIGDGLREMLVTALHGSNRFVVVERMDIKGLAAEQALSRSRMARPGEAIAEAQMDVADVMVYGAVTEFVPEVRGGGLSIGLPNVPVTLGMQGKSAHMAIDVRLVDVASGRVLATGRIVGEAHSTQATIGANISVRGATMPATLGGFQNTPMEQAIRECIEKATAYAVANTPQDYFHHASR
jgi:curli biogenesis system outer membrane secretion channel CsgG/tetratricopeptide (TPR) repeat protein